MVDRAAGSLNRAGGVTRLFFALLWGLLVPVGVTAIIALVRTEYTFSLLYLYLPGLLLVAYGGGLLAGVLAAFVSTALAASLFVEPAAWTVTAVRVKFLPSLLFLLSGILLAVAGVQARRFQARLERDLGRARRQERHEAFLVEVTDLLMGRSPLPELAEAVCEKCAALLGHWCALVLIDPETGVGTLAGFRGTDPARLEERRRALEPALFRREDPLPQRLLEGHSPLRVSRNAAPSPEGSSARWLDDAGMRGALGAPLHVGEDSLGYLVVLTAEDRAWDEDDARLLQAVADRMAQAIQQERQRQQRRRRERDTRFLADLMVEFAREQDLPNLLEVIARRCTEVLGEWCGIQLIDPESEWLRLGALHHQDPAKVQRVRTILEGAPPRRDNPLVARVLEGGQAVAISPDDALVRAQMPEVPVLEEAFVRLRVQATLAVPIYIRGEPAGILGIGADSPRRWDEEDLRLASLIADRAGVAIENARLIAAERRARDNAERETRRLNAVNRVIAIAASALDLGAVFDDFTEALQLLLPFIRVTVSLYEPERDWLTMPYFKGPPLNAPPTSLEGPKAGTVRGWVLDTGQSYVRADTLAAEEFTEDRLLAGAGIRSYVVLPMTVGGRTIGTLNFGHREPGFYTQEHARMVQPIADQLALTLSRFQLLEQAQRRAGEFSETLQRSLLPADLPQVPFTGIGVLYRPADPEAKIGGDWYDAFLLPEDRVLLGIGDVAGRGLGAAATMGQVRHVVRAYALEGRSPAAMLTAVNRFVCLLPGNIQLSMWVGIFDPYFGELVYASAGHPHPYVLSGGQVRALAGAGPPLGFSITTDYAEEHGHLAPGNRLVAYTDGLIEATRDVVEGERRFLAALQATAAEPAAKAPQALVGRTVDEAAPHDDIALLIVDALPVDAPLFLSLPAAPQNLARIRRAVRACAARYGVSPEKAEEIVMAVGEAALNVVEHAYAGGPGMLTVQGDRRGDRFIITLRDFGRWKPREERGRGRGTRIMEGLADSVRTHTGPAGTIVELSWIVRQTPVGTP